VWGKGKLHFEDKGEEIHFWANAILVETDGSLVAGEPSKRFGDEGGKLTIHLYGVPQPSGGSGVGCRTGDTCGVPAKIWASNVDDHGHPGNPAQARKVSDKAFDDVRGEYRGPVDDYFYAYEPLFHDDGDPKAYFGYKVLGVSHGGTLQLYGKKGSCVSGCDNPRTTGESWVRLNQTVSPADAGDKTTLIVDSAVDWTAGDQIVLTTTDYLPGHSELLTVAEDTKNGKTVKLREKVAYHHNGERYPIPSEAVSKLQLSDDVSKGAETRAAVGLLTRSIRIVSGGADAGKEFPKVGSDECKDEDPRTSTCFFGGHVVFRQGFTAVEIQGVEFYQLGQGGRLGHYPLHFHHARKTNPGTFVADSSIWDSMTRWIVLHGTQDVTLARNVGYLSVGHGFYLEDGTEINNSLLTNLGVFARAAVANRQNPRKVPGILAAPDLDNIPDLEDFPYKSDYDHPTVFWITNGWNDFQYNLAVGAGACGSCYWLVTAANSGMSRTVDGKGPRWESYASAQATLGQAGSTPLMKFLGNSCSAAMMSFMTITKTEACIGVGKTNNPVGSIPAIHNPMAGNKEVGDKKPNLDYYPTTDGSGGRFAVQCGGPLADPHADCSKAPRCSEGNPDCMVTVLDHFTTSFNWAAFNFAAVWLRPQWYLLTDSVITDVQQAGLTMVTGGGYSASDVIPGHWALTRKSVFIGHTQPGKPTKEPGVLMPDNKFAADGGPFNPYSGLRCAQDAALNRPANYCMSVDEGVSFQMSNFGMYQRLFSVYDGPAFQESNAYLNIKRREIDDCKPFTDAANKVGRCQVGPEIEKQFRQSAWLAGVVQGLPLGLATVESKEVPVCYMPNAAIGWKQPNGFYYPPAFHSTNLYFGRDDDQGQGGVDIRHFVVSPLFLEGTLTPDTDKIGKQYCVWSRTLFNGFAGNDRQTVLNDDDGSLTGYKESISVNLDDFFLAPVKGIECRSEQTARVSPYEYVTTVVYPACVIDKTCAKAPNPPPPDGDGNKNLNFGDWNRACTNESCYGVPLFRQDLMPNGDRDPNDKNKTLPRSIRMMGQETGQRSTLTVNHGTYYLDTAVSKATQLQCTTAPCVINEFKKNETYYLFLIFAKDSTEQKYQFYVGTDTDFDPASIRMVQANIGPNPVKFSNDLGLLPAGRAKWLDKEKGFVEVTVKLADLPNLDKKIETARKNKCQPATFCTWNSTSKTCNDCEYDKTGKCKDSGVSNICHWASADLDCPDGGCFGIAFTLPDKFSTEPAPATRPTVACLEDAPPWNVSLDSRKVDDGVCPAAEDKRPNDFCEVQTLKRPQNWRR
jgi:hypothetical protein